MSGVAALLFFVRPGFSVENTETSLMPSPHGPTVSEATSDAGIPDVS